MSINFFRKTLYFMWEFGRLWLIITFFVKLTLGFLPVISVWITAELVNEVSNFILDKSVGTEKIILLLLVQLLVMFIQASSFNFTNIIDLKCEQKLDFILEEKISRKSAEVPILYFDNHQFHDHLERIYYNKATRLMSPVKELLNILQYSVSLCSLILFLINIHWLIALLGAISSIPVLLVQMLYGNKHYHLLKYQTPSAREAMYVSALLNDRDSASEIRLFNLKEYLIKRWSVLFIRNNKELMKLTKKKETAYIALHATSGILYTIALYFLTKLLRFNNLTVGGFVSAMQSIQQTQLTINNLSISVAKVYSEQLYIQDLFKFLEFEDYSIKKYEGNKEIQDVGEIQFNNVSFKYPYSENLVLKNLNFTIKKGERIAIVGENGSGKTTLIKCLMGLYPITAGSITYDKVSISDIKPESVFNNVTTIFQDFTRYNFSIKDNIVLNASKNNEAYFTDVVKQTKVDDVAKKYKNTYETILGKVYAEGEDLSGGQWQKIALARAIFKHGQVFVLDEPTAALDPLAELEVFDQFETLTKGKTTIFISHRMAAARIADRVFVMKNGEIVEMGSHHQLMSYNSEYSNLYNNQAKWYA